MLYKCKEKCPGYCQSYQGLFLDDEIKSNFVLILYSFFLSIFSYFHQEQLYCYIKEQAFSKKIKIKINLKRHKHFQS